MRRSLWLVLFAAALIWFLPGTAAADDCGDVCTSSTPCDTECGWDEGKGGPVTCGEYGLCDEGGGSCSANYQVVSTNSVGSFQYNYYSPISCDFIVVYERTWHDVNNCPGSTDYTTCFYSTQASRPDHFCCNYYTCGGQTSC